MKEIISTDKAPSAIGPYSQAVKAGGFLFISGQIPVVPATGEIAEGCAGCQARQCLENMRNVLAEAGLTMDDVVKVTVFITDMEDFAMVNKNYREFFTRDCPARSCVEVRRLPKDVKVEMEAIAVCK